MSAIPPETLQKLATLSRLSFPQEQLEAFAKDFNNILQFVETIQKVDTKGVPPLTSTVSGSGGTPMRADVVTSPTSIEARNAALTNAPRTEQGFFVVPKIVE